MFKIIALVTALSGQPIDVLVSNQEHLNCPNVEAMANIGNKLQSDIDRNVGEHKYNISSIKCVSSDAVMMEAKKLLIERGA